MDDLCNSVENGFVSKFYQALFFKRSFSWSKAITFCGQKGLRIDRVFECEVQSMHDHTITIGCTYKHYNDPKTYRTEYKLDVKRRGYQRETWVHVDR